MENFKVKLRSSSKRKKMAISQDVDISPSSIKKSKDAHSAMSCVLLTLPVDIQDLLFKYLDVKSLEDLSKTCTFYDQMINGRYITTMTLPFKGDFLKELQKTEVIEKKPILRLEFKEGEHGNMLQSQAEQLKKYVVESQMPLLSVHLVREIDLMPRFIPGHDQISPDEVRRWQNSEIEMSMLTHLSNQGVLKNISMLDLLLISTEMGDLLWKTVISEMRSLRNLRITVVEKMAV